MSSTYDVLYSIPVSAMWSYPFVPCRNERLAISRRRQDFVHCASSISVQVERNVLEPKLAKTLGHNFHNFRPKRPLQFTRRNFKPHEIVMMAYAKLTKAKLAHNFFTAINGG